MTDVTLIPALTGKDFDDVVRLCWSYRDLLLALPGVSREVTDAFHPSSKYETLMANLPRIHARPKGIILLARDAKGIAIGCGMSHPLDDQTSEIKRVFVTEEARGKGVAAQLCQTLITQAQSDGFTRVVLDTHRLLHAAQRVYLRLGFTPRGPYQPVPDNVLHELLFYEISAETTA